MTSCRRVSASAGCPSPTATGRRAFPGASLRSSIQNILWLMVQEWGQRRHRTSSGVHTGPKGMSHNVGDDTGDAEVGHPGCRVLWGENRDNLGQGTPGTLVPRGPATLPGWGRMAPDAPGKISWKWPGGHWGGGLTWSPRDPAPLTCSTRAAVSTQQALKQMEKPRRSSDLLPKSSTTNTCAEGAQGKRGGSGDPSPARQGWGGASPAV